MLLLLLLITEDFRHGAQVAPSSMHVARCGRGWALSSVAISSACLSVLYKNKKIADAEGPRDAP